MNYGVGKTIVDELRSNRATYTWFYDYVVSVIVGRNFWRIQSAIQKGTTLATVSDEALALLLLENSWDCWVEKVINQHDRVDDAPNTSKRTKHSHSAATDQQSQQEEDELFNIDTSEPKFDTSHIVQALSTTSTTSKNVQDIKSMLQSLENAGISLVQKKDGKVLQSSTKRYKGKHRPLYTLQEFGAKENKGWSPEGMSRFEELNDLVREDRQTHGTAFDQAYLRNKQERFGTKYRQKKIVGSKRKEITRAAPVDFDEAFLCEDSSDDEIAFTGAI